MIRAVMQQALDTLIGQGYYDTTQQREAIAALRAELAKPDGWILVSNSLPMGKDPVLTYDHENGICEATYHVDGGWYAYEQWWEKGPTHWMPLPLPPT